MSTLIVEPQGAAASSAPRPSLVQLVTSSPPTWVYRQDGYSRVWRVDSPEGALIITRFDYLPITQMVQSLLGRHPVQREVKVSAELEGKGFPVVPPVGTGKLWSVAGCRYWFASPFVGRSVRQLAREGELEQPQFRKQVIDGIAALVAMLIEKEYHHPDLRLRNIVVDRQGKIGLINVGRVARAKKRPQILKMLASLLHSLAQEDIPPQERLYLLTQVRNRCEFLGPVDRLGQDIDRIPVRHR